MLSDEIDAVMRRALELAWESTCAGSLGIGCVMTDDAGAVVATGRNRLFAPDPLFRGVEAILDVNDFVASRRPSIEQRPIDTWSVVALMLPTHAQAFGSADWGWADALPMVWGHARDLVDDKTVIDCATAAVPFDELLERLAPRLAACVDEVAALARS